MQLTDDCSRLLSIDVAGCTPIGSPIDPIADQSFITDQSHVAGCTPIGSPIDSVRDALSGHALRDPFATQKEEAAAGRRVKRVVRAETLLSSPALTKRRETSNLERHDAHSNFRQGESYEGVERGEGKGARRGSREGSGSTAGRARDCIGWQGYVAPRYHT